MQERDGLEAMLYIYLDEAVMEDETEKLPKD